MAEEIVAEKYSGMTDEQLIEQLRAGDKSIMDYILNKYKPLVLGKANAMYLIGGDTDDLIQAKKYPDILLQSPI